MRVIVLSFLVYPYFELDIEKDETRTALLIKQETGWMEWLWTCSKSHRGRLLERGV